MDLVDGARAGNPPAPTRGPKSLRTWKQNSAVLAGISDGLANEGVQAGEPTLLGLKKAEGVYIKFMVKLSSKQRAALHYLKVMTEE